MCVCVCSGYNKDNTHKYFTITITITITSIISMLIVVGGVVGVVGRGGLGPRPVAGWRAAVEVALLMAWCRLEEGMLG